MPSHNNSDSETVETYFKLTSRRVNSHSDHGETIKVEGTWPTVVALSHSLFAVYPVATNFGSVWLSMCYGIWRPSIFLAAEDMLRSWLFVCCVHRHNTARKSVFCDREIHFGPLHIVIRSAKITIWSSPKCISCRKALFRAMLLRFSPWDDA